jgi:hypothetical protein
MRISFADNVFAPDRRLSLPLMQVKPLQVVQGVSNARPEGSTPASASVNQRLESRRVAYYSLRMAADQGSGPCRLSAFSATIREQNGASMSTADLSAQRR